VRPSGRRMLLPLTRLPLLATTHNAAPTTNTPEQLTRPSTSPTKGLSPDQPDKFRTESEYERGLLQDDQRALNGRSADGERTAGGRSTNGLYPSAIHALKNALRPETHWRLRGFCSVRLLSGDRTEPWINLGTE
jgi:hypothetical protein